MVVSLDPQLSDVQGPRRRLGYPQRRPDHRGLLLRDEAGLVHVEAQEAVEVRARAPARARSDV